MPIAIPIIEGAAEAGEGLEALAEAAEETYEAYRARKAAAAAAKLAAAAKAVQAANEGAQTEACSTCEPERRKNPCKQLERGNGTGKYRGGSHRQMTKPAKDSLESHHMPPADSIKGKLSENDGAAIQMEEVDHEETRSWGKSKDAQLYREQQRKLIEEGRFNEAFENDAADARRIAAESGDPTRYDEAIKEARAYADCLQQHKLE